MKKRNTVISMSLACALTSASALAADNRQNFNGSYCDNYYGSQSGDFNRQYNGIRNNATSGRYVSCPLVVDEASVLTGTNNVWVHYSGTGTATCNLYSMNGNGTIRQSQNGNGNGWFSIPLITTDDYWGSYSMYCYLPSGGTLNTISTSEKD